MQALSLSPSRIPVWLMATGLGGVLWNAYGLFQFAQSVTATEADLVAAGLTAAQAAVMTGYPFWMTLAFAIGVTGGLAGSVLILLRHRAAVPVLGGSLAAYLALWIGDALHGVFAAMGTPQVVVVTLVVAIAAGLLLAARRMSPRRA